jgi:hypothetical protein
MLRRDWSAPSTDPLSKEDSKSATAQIKNDLSGLIRNSRLALCSLCTILFLS